MLNIEEKFSKNLNLIQEHITKIIHHDWVSFIPAMQGQFNTCKSMNVIHHIDSGTETTWSSY